MNIGDGMSHTRCTMFVVKEKDSADFQLSHSPDTGGVAILKETVKEW